MEEETAKLIKRLKDLQENLSQLQKQSSSKEDEQLKVNIQEVTQQIQQVEAAISKVNTAYIDEKSTPEPVPGPSTITEQPPQKSTRLSKRSSEKNIKYQEKLAESAQFIKSIDNVTESYKENKDRIFAPAKPALPPTHKEQIKSVILSPKSSPSSEKIHKLSSLSVTRPWRPREEKEEKPKPPKVKAPEKPKFERPIKASRHRYIVLSPKDSHKVEEPQTQKAIKKLPSKLNMPKKLVQNVILSPKSSIQVKPEKSNRKYQTVVLSPKSSLQMKAKKPDVFKTVILSPKRSLQVQTKKLSTFKTVILSPKRSLQEKTNKPELFKTVILSPTISQNDKIKKELNKIGSKYQPQKKTQYKVVILSPTRSVQKKKSPITISHHTSHHVPLPSRSELPHPEPEVLDENLILTQEERPADLLSGLDPEQRSELDMAERILAMIAEGNPKDKFLNQLKAFGIPDQKKLLRYLLEGDLHSFDFGGLMRKYYSYVLRSYTLVNMQDNYREPYNFATCFAALDVSKIGSKAEEQEKEMSKKLDQREEKQEDLRFIAVDEEHFKYLKQLADEQPTTIPLTVIKGLVFQAMPILIDTYRTYARSLGAHHPCTKSACQQYLRMKSRLQLYNSMEKSHDANNEK